MGYYSSGQPYVRLSYQDLTKYIISYNINYKFIPSSSQPGFSLLHPRGVTLHWPTSHTTYYLPSSMPTDLHSHMCLTQPLPCPLPRVLAWSDPWINEFLCVLLQKFRCSYRYRWCCCQYLQIWYPVCIFLVLWAQSLWEWPTVPPKIWFPSNKISKLLLKR